MGAITWFFIILFSGILLLAYFIDLRRKKNNNNPHSPSNPHAKSGESSNYMFGDNKYTGGGE